MIVTIFLFARARELAAADRVAIELPRGATVATLRAALAASYPVLAALLATSAIAVNHEFADAEQLIADSDEVAIIPPVSGG